MEKALSGREEMLARIGGALGRRTTAPPERLAPFSHAPTVAPSQGELVSRFTAEVLRLGGRVAEVRSAAEVKGYLESLLPAGRPATVALSDGAAACAPGLRAWLAGRDALVVPSLREFARVVGSEQSEVGGDPSAGAGALMENYKRALLEADIGVTTADYAIADSGTLVLVSGGEQHRLISLLPPVHVCLLDAARLSPDANGLMARLREQFYSPGGRTPQATTFITGPSRTADIEHTVTLGVHGPRELHVLLVRSRL